MSFQVRSSGPAILCVDDELSILRLLIDVLGAAGYRVLIAPSAERALKMLRYVAVEAVVLDYVMPRMDGLALAQNVQRLDPGMPVVVFCAAPEQLPQELRKLAAKVVDKGNPIESLIAALPSAIAQRRTLQTPRSHPRYHVDLKVLLTAGAKIGQGELWAEARSLGEGGLGAELPTTLPEGDTVRIDLSLRDQKLSLPASVRYHAGAIHGFQFLDITHEQRTAIRKYCETLL